MTQRDTFIVLVDEVEVDKDEAVDAQGNPIPALYQMSGSQITEIVPLAGADCTPAVTALGGPFLALPCRVEYVLTGSGVSTAPVVDVVDTVDE